MVPPARFELAAPGLGNLLRGLAKGLKIHISLSYFRIFYYFGFSLNN